MGSQAVGRVSEGFTLEEVRKNSSAHGYPRHSECSEESHFAPCPFPSGALTPCPSPTVARASRPCAFTSCPFSALTPCPSPSGRGKYLAPSPLTGRVGVGRFHPPPAGSPRQRGEPRTALTPCPSPTGRGVLRGVVLSTAPPSPCGRRGLGDEGLQRHGEGEGSPHSFRDITESFRDITESFRDITESFRDITESFRDITESFRDITESFRDITESIRDITESFGDTSELFGDIR